MTDVADPAFKAEPAVAWDQVGETWTATLPDFWTLFVYPTGNPGDVRYEVLHLGHIEDRGRAPIVPSDPEHKLLRGMLLMVAETLVMLWAARKAQVAPTERQAP
jgi:hypothetical protein